jgi:hypothetical protein
MAQEDDSVHENRKDPSFTEQGEGSEESSDDKWRTSSE